MGNVWNIMTAKNYKVLVVAGYYKEEEKFGKQVIDNLWSRRGSHDNIGLYVVQSEKRPRPGTICQVVDSEIRHEAIHQKAELIVEVQHSTHQDAADLKLSPGEIMWGLHVSASLRDVTDYAWYSSYMATYKSKTFISLASQLDPDSLLGFDVTWLVVEAYLSSLAKGGEITKNETDRTADAVRRVVNAYREYRNKMRSDKYREGMERRTNFYVREWEKVKDKPYDSEKVWAKKVRQIRAKRTDVKKKK